MLEISTKDIAKCLVCNEIASGVHYGVLTCEGCKGFYRRAITTNACEGSSLLCYGTPKNQCNIAYRVRHVCQRCRLQKCFNVGMTRKHSKLGRKRKLQMEAAKSFNYYRCDNVMNENEFKERIKQENKYFLREIGIFSNEDSSQSKSETKTILKEGQVNHSKLPQESKSSKVFQMVYPFVCINNNEIDQLFVQMNDFIQFQNRTDPNYMLFQKFRKVIPQAHMETCIVTIPIMENFFDNNYRNIMVDNDPDSVWNVMFHEMEPITSRVVSFCNKLPDFKTVLPFSDAIIVIKLALFDIISIRYLRIVDLDRNQFFDPRLTRKIPADVMAKNPLGPLFLRYLYVAEFIKLELIDPVDDYEMAYLSALCLTLPGWDSRETKFSNSGHLNKLKFFYCLCLYDHLVVRKFKGNILEAKIRMRRLYDLLDKIKIVTKTQESILLSMNEKENFVEQFQLIFKQT